MDSVITTGIISGIQILIASVLGFMFGRKKSSAETEKILKETHGVDLGNIMDTIKIYEIVNIEMKAQLTYNTQRCTELGTEMFELRKENLKLKADIKELTMKLESEIQKQKI